MTELIIPDVHDKVHKVARLLEKVPHDHATLLSDFFDDWHTNSIQARTTAEHVQRWLNDPKITCVLGNHDMAYGWGHINRSLLCSGWTKDKAIAIHSVLAPGDWAKFKLHHWIETKSGRLWLLSHAGLYAGILEGCPREHYRQSVDNLCEQALDCLFTGQMHPLLGAGRSRGGPQSVGGINWLDWDEFVPIPGLNQLVGHTQGKMVRWKRQPASENACIDTTLRHYALIEDGVLDVKEWK